ncbi:MAG: hypothetical protein K2Y39_21885 [Candidatus Obscuribacterales bacterium]|nr:hypothetical protein [Candidatus Obscuribacterales bacterium]
MVEDYSKHSRPLVSESLVQNDLKATEASSADDNLSSRFWHGEIGAGLDNLKQVESTDRGTGMLSSQEGLSAGIYATPKTYDDWKQILKERSDNGKIENRLYLSDKQVNLIDCGWGKRLDFSEEAARKTQWEEERRRLLEIDMTPYIWNHSSF